MQQKRLLIVDDHEVVREGLASALAADERFEIVGTAATGKEALQRARQTLPDIALVDLRLPDMRGEDLTREIRTRFPSTAVIILTTYLGEGTVRSAIERVMEDGTAANGQAAPQIVKQLHAVVASRMDDAIPTPRQEAVLELAAQGMTNGEIGERLYISESTVRFHVQKLKEKFSARTKTELIAKAIRTGFIAPALEDGVSQVEL